MSRPPRVLAIDPGPRGFGFAVMEGPKRLVDWGLGTSRRSDNGAALSRIENLVGRYRPAVIVLEAGAKRRQRVQQLLKTIEELARRRKIRTRSFSADRIKRTFAGYRAETKQELVVAVIHCLPELAIWYPRSRKPWTAEDHRMQIFDAVKLALTFYDVTVRRRRGPLD